MNPPSQRLLPPLPKLKPSMLCILNSQSISLLPTTNCMLYSKTMRNYITWSILSRLSTSPTTVLKKFEFEKNNLSTASFNSPSTRDSNNVSSPWYKKYADENLHHDEHIHPRPLHGIPQDPLDPIDKILHLYNNMWTSTTHGMNRMTPTLQNGKKLLTNGTPC